MAAQPMFTGPHPEPGREFCAVCAMVFKAQAVAALTEAGELDKVKTMPDGTLKWFKIAGLGHQPLEYAVAKSVYQPLMQLGPLPLCWSHMLGLSMTSGLLPASAAQLPTDATGVPLLGQGRRG